MTGTLPLVVLVGEVNPLGTDPRYALYDEPIGCAGARLRTRILGLERRTYFGDQIARVNLCIGTWRMPFARAAIIATCAQHPESTIVLFGRKVAEAYGRSLVQKPPAPFERRGRVLALPHPSGRNTQWNDPQLVLRARNLLRQACPQIPWGEYDAQRLELTS